ncbi:hypothetical protein [Pontibacter roseus]|uniref:hypothetical protein n=1 Tax=Pontibacter roseus TaxID=336989 RepID=UPI000361C3FB|nr:hypothetical protein [Pontibacter roseus]
MKISFLFPLFLLLWGCSERDEPAAVVVPECLLVEQTTALTYDPVLSPDNPNKPQTITTRLEYTEQQALATIFQTDYTGTYFDRTDVKYNKKGQVTEVVQQYNRYVNEYNGQGKLAKQTRFNKRTGDYKEEELGYYTLTYDSQQDLAEALYVSMASGRPVPELMWRYTYIGGNPVTVEQLVPGGESYYQVKLAYDDRNQPSTSLAHTYFEPLRPPAAHNLVSYTVQDDNPIFPSHTTAYTYNAQGFPITATTRFTDGRVEEVSYTYRCR